MDRLADLILINPSDVRKEILNEYVKLHVAST
jgi:hypothetical protein